MKNTSGLDGGMRMVNVGLVLEGGGMKGVYTAGVLDYFIEKICISSAVMVFPQVPVIYAVIFPNKRNVRFG